MTEPARDLALVDEGLLPPQIRELVRLIGLPETLRFLEARGGIPTRIAKYPGRAVTLREIGLSEASIEALCDAWGDTVIDTPMPDKLLQQLRDLAIRAERAAGVSAAQVARRYRLTRRRIVQIHTASPDDEPTVDLFQEVG